MNRVNIRKISITELRADAIVNAANSGLQAGGGVCGAIFKAAGYEQLQTACDKIGHCDTGSAVITPGFKSKAKYIIHAVGPRWTDGKHHEAEQLCSAYYSSLELAVQNNCKSIAFPLISAGIYGYPTNCAWRCAFDACADFLGKHHDVSLNIIFAVMSDEMLETGTKELLKSEASRYKTAVRSDWKTFDMPEQHDEFILNREFTQQQMKLLKRGHIPQEMEDKWFWYMEGDTLFAHRSWTGLCVYRVDFQPGAMHVVTVNRNPEQYKCTSLQEDAQQLNNLFNWWTQENYDYYHEWLSETVVNLQKAAAMKKSEETPKQLKISGNAADALFFHKPDEPNGFLSNRYPSPFELDGQRFSSVEQYIMYRKCVIFGDEASAKAVMAAKDTAEQQTIGRNVSGYISAVWAGARQMEVLRGLLAKFGQNEELKKKLLDTGDAYLVECAGSDKIWACGLRLDDDKRFDASNWTGSNILGFALMEARKMLR